MVCGLLNLAGADSRGLWTSFSSSFQPNHGKAVTKLAGIGIAGYRVAFLQSHLLQARMRGTQRRTFLQYCSYWAPKIFRRCGSS